MTFASMIGTMVKYAGHRWLVVDVHGYPVRTVDLRRTLVVDPKRRHLDKAESRRGVAIADVQVLS